MIMIIEIILYTFLSIFLGYILCIAIINIGLTKLKKPEITDKKPVSIIIAARNEEDNIGSCLESLVKQNYYPEKMEIIVINDRSEDHTGEIIKSYCSKYNNIKYTYIADVPKDVSPKQNAILEGIKIAKNEIILLTDADCLPQPEWVNTIQSYFDNQTGAVLGFSPIINKYKNEVLKKFIYTDSLSLAVLSAGSTKIGLPLTCTGRNFAYRKRAFFDAEGFGDTIKYLSGDDDLLLYRIKKKTKWKIEYATGENSLNESFVHFGLKSFINQKIRHSSKFKCHPLYVKVFSAIVFLMNLFIIFFPVTFLFNTNYLNNYLLILILKFISEYLLLNYGRKFFELKFDILAFFISFVIHPFYVVFLSILGLTGKFKWK